MGISLLCLRLQIIGSIVNVMPQKQNKMHQLSKNKKHVWKSFHPFKHKHSLRLITRCPSAPPPPPPQPFPHPTQISNCPTFPPPIPIIPSSYPNFCLTPPPPIILSSYPNFCLTPPPHPPQFLTDLRTSPHYSLILPKFLTDLHTPPQ